MFLCAQERGTLIARAGIYEIYIPARVCQIESYKYANCVSFCTYVFMLHVCMYVCMYKCVCMYVYSSCMYVFISVCVQACTYVHTYVTTCSYSCTSIALEGVFLVDFSATNLNLSPTELTARLNETLTRCEEELHKVEEINKG